MPLQVEHLKDLILSTREDSLASILNILEYNLQNDSGEKIIISTINQLLNNSKTRLKGLQLINSLLGQCSVSVLTENASNWIGYCVVNNQQDRMKEIKLETITKIIQTTQNVENFNRKIISDHLLEILKVCLNPTNLETGVVLTCLAQCMQHYSAWFGNHKQKIEPYLLKCLDESNENVVKQTALCLFYYQQTGSAGIESINYTTNFLTQTNKLCATIHLLYDVLFESINEIAVYDKIDCETIKFNPPPIDYNSGQILELTTQRIINCLVCLKTMLLKKYPATKQIIPKYLVDVINRGLTPHLCLNQADLTIEMNTLGFSLNKIQVQLFKLYRGLTMGYLSSLLPFSHALSKLLVNVLKRTETCDCFKHNLLYRKVCHQTVSDWFALTNCNEKHFKSLIPILLKNCFPTKQTVVLNVGKKQKIKGRGDKINNNLANTDKKLSKFDETIQEVTCWNSLKTLKSCIKVISDYKLLEEIVSSVVKILFDIKTNRSSPPYSQSNRCQYGLYQILIEILKNNHPKLSISLHLIIELFNFNLNNRQLSSICNEGLSLIEKITHPICPSLEIPESKPAESNGGKIQILSNIVIQTNNLENEDNSADIEEICEISSDENQQKIDSIDEIEEVRNGDIREVEVSLKKKAEESADNDRNGDNVKEIEVSLKKKLDDVKQTETPPLKKMKEDSAELEEMFNSFQDIIQE